MNGRQDGNHFAKKFPELGTGPISADSYRNPAFFEREKDAIFRRTWQFAGRVEQIPEPGDFFLRSVPAFDLSLIFVRGSDGKVRGFHNACRHRGNHVCLEEQGSCRAFTCKFHGWIYNLEGELVSVHDEGGLANADKKKLGLVPVSTDVWEGFIFFNLESAPALSLAQYLGELGERLQGFPFHEYSTHFRYAAVIKANWKTVIDAFSEVYHLPSLHKLSLSTSLGGPENPFCHLLEADAFGPHRMFSVWGNKKYRPHPVQGIAYEFAGGGSIIGGAGEREDLPIGVNPTRSDNWGLDANIFFPNVLPMISAGMFITHQMWPISVDSTQWELSGYLRPAETAAQRFTQEYFKVELRDALLE
ncbi:MAG: Rieske 2Fe-2S domain-containing protein, partial [Rhodospirillales bacterium]|nr:Rieske 2Fe-2S domain-containing protein [Rhodospirillales bacterium]